MSNARSPREVCSTTIGISGLMSPFWRLAPERSLLAEYRSTLRRRAASLAMRIWRPGGLPGPCRRYSGRRSGGAARPFWATVPRRIVPPRGRGSCRRKRCLRRRGFSCRCRRPRAAARCRASTAARSPRSCAACPGVQIFSRAAALPASIGVALPATTSTALRSRSSRRSATSRPLSFSRASSFSGLAPSRSAERSITSSNSSSETSMSSASATASSTASRASWRRRLLAGLLDHLLARAAGGLQVGLGSRCPGRRACARSAPTSPRRAPSRGRRAATGPPPRRPRRPPPRGTRPRSCAPARARACARCRRAARRCVSNSLASEAKSSSSSGSSLRFTSFTSTSNVACRPCSSSAWYSSGNSHLDRAGVARARAHELLLEALDQPPAAELEHVVARLAALELLAVDPADEVDHADGRPARPGVRRCPAARTSRAAGRAPPGPPPSGTSGSRRPTSSSL